MKKHVVSWSTEQINPTKLGVGTGFSSMEIPTDCSYFRLCFEGRHQGSELFDFKVENVLHLSMNVSEGVDGEFANRIYVFEPPFKGPDVWYDQRILIESVGTNINLLNYSADPTKSTAVSIYIERWYYDA